MNHSILAQLSTQGGGSSNTWVLIIAGVVSVALIGGIAFLMARLMGGGKREHGGVRFSEYQVDEYKLLNMMMSGQSSQVWEVAHVAGGQHFAMKMLLPEHNSNAQQRQFLYHEAEVGKDITHPKIIRILSLVKDNDHPYFLMEFFPSKNLKLRLMHKEEAFLKENAKKIIEQAALALAFMNERGWVHRDVKPDNILVNSSADVRLIDFALAVRVTKSGRSMFGGKKKTKPQGTRSYMSPEQIRGEALDARADIYSFGATIYELLAGRPPFVAGSSMELLNKHIAEKPVSPMARNTDLTDDISNLILRMLSKKRDERPRDFHDFLLKFRSIRLYKPVPVPKKPE